MAYVLCKSVIDHTKITVDELIYLVSDALASRSNVPSVEVDITLKAKDPRDSTKFVDVKRKVRVLADESGKAITKKNNSTDLSDYTPVMVDGNALTSSVPPTIGAVEAYIGELNRVWKKLKEDRSG